MRKLWITDQPYPASTDVLAAAEAAGATEVLHGIPISLQKVIPESTQGYFELQDPPAGPELPPLSEVFADVPVQTLAEANAVLASLQQALEARGIV